MKKKDKILFWAIMILVGIAITFVGISFKNMGSKIKKLEQEISYYESYTEELETNSSKREDYIYTLELKNDELAYAAEKYKNELANYEKQEKEQAAVKASASTSSELANDSGFRSWMPYTALATGTPQHKVISKANPNEYGILEYDGCAVVAVGFGWGLDIGDCATVTTTNGTFKIVVGDWKAKCDTDTANKVTTANGCVVEFIVDREQLASAIKRSGNVASVAKYSGKVISITSDDCNILDKA